jgi:flavin reductase (DIM6/NTAB) family NADH-FMN oxidoreductase RutF
MAKVRRVFFEAASAVGERGSGALPWDPLKAIVAPRPIGWVTTCSPEGVVNLAPYSFFNIISTKPHFVLFSSSSRKHSQRNAEASGEFVFNLATYDLRTEMNITGSDHTEEISEADLAGLEMVPCRKVKPPRVARSPIALECIYNKTVDLVPASGKTSVNSLIIGEVVNVHIDDSVIVNSNIDMARIRPLARLGYMDYTSVDNIFTMHRVPVQQRVKQEA